MVLLTTFVALAVALTAMIVHDLRDYHRAWTEDMSTQAELLGRTTAPALAFDDPKAASENLALLRLRPHVRAAAIYNARGTLFASFAASSAANGTFPPLPEADGVRVRDRELVVFRRIVEEGEILGTVYLRADYPLYEKILSYAQIALLVMLFAMGVAFLLSSRLQKVVTQPVLAIAQIAREVVAQRDYSRRAPKLSDDEVGTLVESFNDMMAEIEQRTRALETSHRENAREVERTSRAQQQVMRLNAELEQRVHERTAQLERSNIDSREATASAEKAQPREVGVPVQHEPRAAHAAERHPRLRRS